MKALAQSSLSIKPVSIGPHAGRQCFMPFARVHERLSRPVLCALRRRPVRRVAPSNASSPEADATQHARSQFNLPPSESGAAELRPRGRRRLLDLKSILQSDCSSRQSSPVAFGRGEELPSHRVAGTRSFALRSDQHCVRRLLGKWETIAERYRGSALLEIHSDQRKTGKMNLRHAAALALVGWYLLLLSFGAAHQARAGDCPGGGKLT